MGVRVKLEQQKQAMFKAYCVEKGKAAKKLTNTL